MTDPVQRTPSRDLEGVLVDAAERVLVREGVRGMTVRAVATEAGVAPMGVYNRFGSKYGLIAAVLIRGFDGLAESIRVREDTDPAHRLGTCGRSYRRFALAKPQHYEAMFGGGVSPADRAAASSDELKEHAAAAFGVLVDEVARAMEVGVLRRDDPREVASVIWSAVHGAVALELAGVTQTADPDATFERLLAGIADGLG